jgi:predicted Fe-Mo cluster-binding NifX family protein
MKIAIPSTGKDLSSDISCVFGRSPEFIIINLENNEIKDVSSVINPAKNERGAGNIAAQFIVDQGIEALILGELGNVAFGILRNAGIKIYKINQGNVKNNIKSFKEGKLEEIKSVSSGFPGTSGKGPSKGGGMRR